MRGPIPFQGFNERGDVGIYAAGDLPHWRQEGCTYFVTFRLADALPQAVICELKAERQRWLKGHGIDFQMSDWKSAFAKLPMSKQREYERKIGTDLNRQLDRGLGSCVLRGMEPMNILAEALAFHHGDRAWAGDFVIMPNHVHVLMTPMAGDAVEHVLKSIKGYSAREINRVLGRHGPLWQRESYDHIVRDTDQLERFQLYIRDNPAKANLREGDYHLSKATYEPA